MARNSNRKNPNFKILDPAAAASNHYGGELSDGQSVNNKNPSRSASVATDTIYFGELRDNLY